MRTSQEGVHSKRSEGEHSDDVSRMRHELRNRAGVVAGLSALLVEQLDEPHTQILEYVRRLSHNAKRLEVLVEELGPASEGAAAPEATVGLGQAPVGLGLTVDPVPAVLVVEDDSEHFHLVQALLSEGAKGPRWRALRAASLADASRMVNEVAPVCTLVDLNLPDASGLEAPMQLRALAPQQPIIVVTGENDDQLGIDAVRHGAQDYLVKGRLTREILGRAIQYAIERRRLEHEISHRALHDQLTGIPNRALFLDRFHLALERQKRHDAPLAVAFIDLDDFKRINDEYGHQGGDEVLTAVAERLASSMRAVDAVARYGGDEFVVLRESLKDEAEGEQLARQIRRTFTSPFVCPGLAEVVTASVGVAVAMQQGSTSEALLRTADHAMYMAKGRGCDEWEVLLANEGSRVSTHTAVAK